MTLIAILFALLGLLIFPNSVYADFTFTIAQTIITPDQDINTTVTLSLQGQNNKTYYLEGAFKKEGSSNYFGLTWNDSSWVPYTASNFTILKPITTDQTGKWNGVVKVKIDQGSNLFSGNGTYSLRLKRFTTGGNGYWAENSVIITVDSLPSPIPSPSPSTTPIPTPSPPPSLQLTSLFTISNTPSQINSNQSFKTSVNLTLPNNKNSTYYLSGAFKKVGGTRYFGLTKIDSNWAQYNSSNYLNQYKITTDDSGNWTGTLEVKPDIEDSDYKGSGDYIFKVARYLSNSSLTWSNEAAITINDVTNDYNSDSSTPQPTLNIISSASPKPASTQSPTPKPTQSLKYSYQIASVAAATTSATAAVRTATSEAGAKVKNQKQNNPIIWIGIILIFAGLSSIGYIYLKSHGKIPIKF